MFPAIHGVVSQGGAIAPPAGEFTGIASWSTPGTRTFVAAGRHGWVFQVGAQNLTVQKLRSFVAVANLTWRVIIHRNSDNAIMAQGDVVTGAADQWHEVSVTPAVLASGATYTVSARPLEGGAQNLWRNPTGIAYASGITLVDDGIFGPSGSDARPTSASGQDYTPVADFTFTV